MSNNLAEPIIESQRKDFITLPYKFVPRWYQLPFFKAMAQGIKRSILVHHRRAGKDCCAWNFTISEAYRKKGIYYYIFPTFAQGRKVLWDGMTNDGFRFLDFIPKELVLSSNNQEMKIRLKNGSLIQVLGSDKYDALMGTNPTGCIFSEYSLQNPNAWQFLRPILDVNKGWAIFVFTPRGQNHAKELFDNAKDPKNKDTWFTQLLTVDDTGILTKKEIKDLQEKENVSEDMIQQEYYCSFTLGIQGSYYAKYLQEANDSGRVGTVPHDPQSRVYTAWDLGVGDSTCIIFYQLVGKEIRCIDYYENSGEGLPHYAKIVKDKSYIYGGHYAPHDLASREMSHGLSRREVAASLGLNMTVLPTLKLTKEEAIECVRGRFHRCWFDQVKCKRLLLCLENYRKEWNDKLNVYAEKPRHDWASHGADAFSYLCHAVKLNVDNQSQGPSDEDVERMRDRYQPVFT